MRLLLDTHALIWWLNGDARLSRAAKAAIGDADNAVYVSAASAWEITTKHRLGKLSAGPLADDVEREIVNQNFDPLPVTLGHGQRAGALPGPHKDPFDRMLIAQAQAERLALVSNETIFDHYGVTRLW